MGGAPAASSGPQAPALAPTTFPSASATGSGDFAALGLPAGLVASLAESGIATPFPIQSATIPAALRGQNVLGRGRTGSGKTLSFGLPMLVRPGRRQHEPGRAPRGLILAPTRELAMQVVDVLQPLARDTGLAIG